MSVYIPLKEGSKQAAVSGWASPTYGGVEHHPGDWHALRTDGLVVVDFDNIEAIEQYGARFPETVTIRTPRGVHLIYRHTPGSPEGPAVGVFPGVDIRAGRGAYIVSPDAPDREVLRYGEVQPFDPAWLPTKPTRGIVVVDEWDTVPEGRRNHTLTTIGGALRKAGASTYAIARALAAVNAVIMEEPLDRDEVVLVAQSVSRYDPHPDPVIEVEE